MSRTNQTLTAWFLLIDTNEAGYDYVIENSEVFSSEWGIDNLRSCYFRYSIHKKNGNTRQVEAPNKNLKRVQRFILSQMKNRFNLHSAAMAVVGKSYVDNASPHVGAKHVFKTDIMDFYPTVTKNKVDTVVKDYFPEQENWMNARTALLYFRTGDLLQPHLPTGAPTSPFIGNLVLYPIDEALDILAIKYGAKYTRYLDDITLSFKNELDPVMMNDIRNEVCAILVKAGWQPHPQKTRWIDPTHDQFTVTGVDVRAEQKVTSKYVRQKIKSAVERNIQKITFTDYDLPKWLSERTASKFNKFEDVLPVFFIDCLPILGYVKQVNEKQYKQLVEKARVRLNRICELENLSLSSFAHITITKLSVHFQLFTVQQAPCLPDSIKTFDEALVFALQYVLAQKHTAPSKIKQQDGIPDDDLPF